MSKSGAWSTMCRRHDFVEAISFSFLIACLPSLCPPLQFEEMYEQKRREVNKAYEKYEKQLKAAKTSGKNAKANAEKVGSSLRVAACSAARVPRRGLSPG